MNAAVTCGAGVGYAFRAREVANLVGMEASHGSSLEVTAVVREDRVGARKLVLHKSSEATQRQRESQLKSLIDCYRSD